MMELEEVNCETLRVSDLRKLISDRLKNSDDEYGSSVHIQDYDTTNNSLGGFLNGTTYAWMSNDCHLIVFNVKFGENINCCWTFSERITCVSEFPTQPGHLPLLLVGLDNGANKMKDSSGLLCIFDCNTSRVLRAIRTPTGIERVCVVSGGTEWEELNDKRTDNIFCNMDGIACVVLRNLQHIMIDLQRSSWDDPNSNNCMDETSPAELDFSFEQNCDRNKSLSSKEKHMAYNLLNNNIEKYIGFNRIEFESYPLMQEELTSMIIYSAKIGCIISGCLGRIMIWQKNGSIAWISRPLDENMTITHLSLLEPTDDPRPFYYLWVVYEDETLKMPPILRMYALLFERKYCEKGTNLYFNLETEPCLRFEFELEKEDKIISLSPIEREVNPDQADSNIKRGEDNLLLIASNDRLLLFDLNQWYKEQMPQTIYDCKNPNSILSMYCTRFQAQCAGDKLLSTSYIPSTLREFPNNRPCPTEELYYPNSLSFEWAELSTMRLMTWLTRGIQTELLRKMAITGPVILLQPKELFHKCLSVGLVPFNTELSFINDENSQREVLLSLCLEQRWTSFLVKCAMEWSDGSASFLYPSFIKWGVQRASSIKIMADRLCIPLFDQSDSSIGEAEMKTLRFCSQQLECLSNVVGKLTLETDDMIKQRRALRRVSIYLQVLLWFYDVGLLPEIQDLDEERQLPLSLSFRIPYPYEKLTSIYNEKRDAIKNNTNYVQEHEGLFIDMLINKECPILKSQWERESGDVNVSGYYPPPSLQSLLRSYLTDCYQAEINETECKHQIVIYLLMDLVMLLHESYPGVDQLIKYPSAFKMSPSLIKLTQAFWLLDHDDYKGFLNMMTGQLVSDSDVKSWHHEHILRTLVRNDQQKLALMYLRIRKPPILSTSDQSAIVNLSVQHGLVQSAFHCRPPSHYAQLLTCFFEACKSYNKLGDILHLALEPEEEEIFVKFLQENNKSDDMKTLYYLQRCRYSELNNKLLLSQFKNNVPKNMLSTSAAMLKAYDSTLPSVIKQLSSGITKTTFETDLESKYPRPMSHYKCINKQQSIYETVIKKAKETSFQSGKCRIPFITAPCASLKTNESNINISCVLFPTVAYKNRRKRTLDEIYENDNNEFSEGTKRRKLSNDADTANTSSSPNLTVTFDTPLVKRKSNVENNKKTCIETPHSILKIRQLIQNSTSPNLSITQSVETNIPDTPLEKQKKINRQIRFSINSPVQNINHENVIEEQPEEIEEKIPEEISLQKSDTFEKDTELFQSPNTSDKPHNETTKLLSDDSLNDKSNCYPRPRPRLRRSYLTGKNTTNTTATNSSGTSSNLLNTSKDTLTHSTETNKISSTRLHSSLSATMYSTMILSPSSSIDDNASFKEIDETNSLNQSNTPNISHYYKNAVSSTPLVKNKPVKLLDDDDDNNEELTLLNKEEEQPIESLNKNERNKISNDYDKEEINEDSCNEESEHEYKSLPNSPEREINTVDSNVKNDSIEKNNKSSNGLLSPNLPSVINEFDITDDESSNDGSKIVLVYEPSPEDDNKDNIDSETDRPTNINPQSVLHFSDVSNITEDGSNNSNDVKEYNNKKDIRDNVTVRTNKRNLKIDKINELKNVEDSSNDSISNELSSQQVISTRRNVSEIELQKENNITSCTIKLNKISTESKEETTILEESISSRMTTRSKRINSSSKIKKETISIKSVDEYKSKEKLDDTENNTLITTPVTRRTRRSSSLAKDIFPITKIDKESDETVKDKELTRRVTRRASSVQKELTHVSTPIPRRTRSTSISKTADEINANLNMSKLTERKLLKKEEKEEKEEVEKEKEKEKPVRGRLTRSSSTSLITQSNNEQEVLTDVQPKRKRGNSVPKESTIKITQKEKSMTPDIPEGSLTPTLQTRRRRNSISKIVEDISSSPAANTRSRRSSIQPIPEEMEMILNSPQNLNESKETLSNIRTRRATSVDSSSLDVKRRTRGIRKSSIMEDAIIEESMETESQMDSKVTKNTPVKSSKRKRTLSCN